MKDFRGRRRGIASRSNSLSFGEYGLKAIEAAWITSAQIEAARRAITYSLRKGGRVWVRIFPDKPVTARAAGKRMGGGKGDISTYVAVVRPGMVLFEVAGASRDLVIEGLSRAQKKLPIATKILIKEDAK